MRISDWSSDVCSSDPRLCRALRLRQDSPAHRDHGVGGQQEGAGMALRHGVQLVLRDAAGIAMRQLAPGRRLVEARTCLVSGKTLSVRVEHEALRIVKKNTLEAIE